MCAAHDWLSALAIANGKARTTGRRQVVRWVADHLVWTVREVGR